MGILQNAINQTLVTIGAAARLSPEYELKKDTEELNRLEKLQEETDFDENTVEPVTEKQVEVSKRLALARPTEENIKNYRLYSESLAEMRKDANEMAAKKQEQIRAQNEQSKQFRDIFTQGGLYK